MTLQEFESRGQDYADLREALREIEELRAVHVKLLAACEAMLAEMQVWEDEQGTHPAAVMARYAILAAKAVMP